MELPRLEVTVGRPSAAAGGRGGTTERQWSDPAGRVVGRAGGAAGDFWILLDGLAGYRFRPGSAAVRAVRQPGASNERVVDTFERGILPFVLQASGVEVLHASAVLGASGVVALCGESGAGKSTVAAGLGRLGHVVWGDDAVAFDVDRPQATAICLPFRTRLCPDAEAFLCGVGATAGADRAESPRPGRRERLSAILILEAAGPEGVPPGEIASLEPDEAFSALLPHAYYFDAEPPRARRQTVLRYMRLASRVPTYRVRRGDGLQHLSTLLGGIGRLLAAPARPPGGSTGG